MPDSLESSLLAAAREVLRSESASIASIADKLSSTVVKAICFIYDRTSENSGISTTQWSALPPGSLVISGIGKSGLVGQRLSASFASTGTPSHFLHPVEALHGDLGRVRRNDVALLLSYSGETDELVRLLDSLKRQKIIMVAITSARTSTLGRYADITIEL